MIRLLSSFVVLLPLAALAAQDPLERLTKGQPADVVRVIERIVGCSHWAGEEPYDAARKKEISSALKALKCGRVQRDEHLLRKRYAGKPHVLDALKQANEWTY